MTTTPEASITPQQTATHIWLQLQKLLGRFNKHYQHVFTDLQNGNNKSFISLTSPQKASLRLAVREAHILATEMMGLRTQISALMPEMDKKRWNDPEEHEQKWFKQLLVNENKMNGEEFPEKTLCAMMVLKVRAEALFVLTVRIEDKELSEELAGFLRSGRFLIDAIVVALPPEVLPKMEYY
jgi:hypothetical protein